MNGLFDNQFYTHCCRQVKNLCALAYQAIHDYFIANCFDCEVEVGMFC